MSSNPSSPPNCPHCGKSLTPTTGVRGINPNTWRENGWRCRSGYHCDLSGIILFEDTLADPRKLNRLMTINRAHWWVQAARRSMGIEVPAVTFVEGGDGAG